MAMEYLQIHLVKYTTGNGNKIGKMGMESRNTQTKMNMKVNGRKGKDLEKQYIDFIRREELKSSFGKMEGKSESLK